MFQQIAVLFMLLLISSVSYGQIRGFVNAKVDLNEGEALAHHIVIMNCKKPEINKAGIPDCLEYGDAFLILPNRNAPLRPGVYQMASAGVWQNGLIEVKAGEVTTVHMRKMTVARLMHLAPVLEQYLDDNKYYDIHFSLSQNYNDLESRRRSEDRLRREFQIKHFENFAGCDTQDFSWLDLARFDKVWVCGEKNRLVTVTVQKSVKEIADRYRAWNFEKGILIGDYDQNGIAATPGYEITYLDEAGRATNDINKVTDIRIAGYWNRSNEKDTEISDKDKRPAALVPGSYLITVRNFKNEIAVYPFEVK